jgi:hypothetical protein
MPTVTAITLRFSRKFQISRDDWIGADALVTVSASEAEAEVIDPADLRALAIAEARQTVIELVASEYLERTQLAARQHNGQMPATAADDDDQATAPATADHAPPAPAYQRPASAAEAEQRFFARYAEIVSGQDWKSVQVYLGSRAPKPRTVEGCISAAEAVRDIHKARTTPAVDDTPAPTDADRPQDMIADVEGATPAEHATSHAVSHRSAPRPPRRTIPTAERTRAALNGKH